MAVPAIDHTSWLKCLKSVFCFPSPNSEWPLEFTTCQHQSWIHPHFKLWASGITQATHFCKRFWWEGWWRSNSNWLLWMHLCLGGIVLKMARGARSMLRGGKSPEAHLAARTEDGQILTVITQAVPRSPKLRIWVSFYLPYELHSDVTGLSGFGDIDNWAIFNVLH